MQYCRLWRQPFYTELCRKLLLLLLTMQQRRRRQPQHLLLPSSYHPIAAIAANAKSFFMLGP
jgi:hypothetical protein